jgi:hypothetical protein
MRRPHRFLLCLFCLLSLLAACSGPAAHPRASRGATSPPPGPATFAGPAGVEAAWVVAENRRPGTTAWRITGAQSATGILGYANLVQAQAGQTVSLYVSTVAASFRVDAFRMGYYQGTGGRLVWQSGQLPGRRQPACPVAPRTNMVECHWHASVHVTITGAWPQGEYLFKLIGSGGQQGYVPLTVWDPSSHATYVIMAGVLTDEVFNAYGGYDLYQGLGPCGGYPPSCRARVVSFDRPYAYGDGAASYFGLLYPLTRLAEEHGLDVTYWTDITLDTHGNLLRNHKVLISPGHDEEWSLAMRRATTAAVRAGVNVMFMGASAVLRKVRLQASPLGPDREIVNYRDPQADPLYGRDNAEVSQNDWTQPPASEPPSLLVGATYVGFNNYASFPLVVTDPSSWLYAGTGLTAGARIPGVLTSDFQAVVTAEPVPPGLEILAHSPVQIEFHPGPQYADTTYYTVPGSGAGIFQSGSNGWISALQPCPRQAGCPDAMLTRVTLNLLRVFGAGPVGRRYPSHANWQRYYH